MKRAIKIVVLFLILTGFAFSNSPSPEQILGFKPGDDFKLAKWEKIEAYFQALAKSSKNVKLAYLGKSTLGRPFFMAVISSENNLKNLKRIKEINRILHAGQPMEKDQLEDLINKGKPVVAITCTIHSTEVGAALMSTELAYRLVTEEKFREVLDNVVLLLFPSLNPDGIDIVHDWYYEVLGTPYEASYPVKLYHYYAGHDNNRDWLMGNLQETRLVLPVYYKEYFPLLIYDVHQMGKNGVRFFFPPYKDPINPNIDPLLLREVNLIGAEVAKNLTEAGKKGVASGAIFDSWYMSANRACPLRHNVMSFLSEAASANYASPVFLTKRDMTRLRGLKGNFVQSSLLEPWEGGWWHLRDIIEYELITATTLLRKIADKKEYYLRNFYRLSKKQIHAGETIPPYAYIIPEEQRDSAAVKQLIEVLLRQGVRVERAEENFSVDGAYYGKGDFILHLSQPYRAFIKDLLEIKRFPKIEENRNKYVYPYDEAAWSLGLQMGVKVIEAREKFSVKTSIVENPEALQGKIYGEGNYILLPSSSPYSYKVINEVLKRGIGAYKYTKGEGIFYCVRKTPFTSKMVKKLGLVAKAEKINKNNLKPLRHMRTVIYQSYRPIMQEGWIRYVFDKLGVNYRVAHNDFIRSGALLKEADVLIIPDIFSSALLYGRDDVPERYKGGIGEDGALQIENFVYSGGMLIALGRSTLWAIERFHIKAMDAREKDKRKFSSPGSLLIVEVNKRSPLARGFQRNAIVFYDEQPVFDAKEGLSVLTFPFYDPIISGIAFNNDIVRGKSVLLEVKRGKGKIFLYGFKVVNRGQSVGTFNFLLNALYQ